MKRILAFIISTFLSASALHAEEALFDFPKSPECEIQRDGSTDCPSEDEIGRGQSLLCIRRRGVPQECKIVSIWSCGLVSENPSKICEGESTNVRARWRAEFLIRTLQAFESMETTPTSFAQARYKISDDPRMNEPEREMFDTVAAQFFMDGGQCSGGAAETASNTIMPRAEIKIEDMPQSEHNSLIQACVYSTYCSLDAAAHGEIEIFDRLMDVRNTDLCSDVLRRVRASPQASIIDADTERSVRGYLQVISSDDPNADYLWAFISASRVPEVSGTSIPGLRMVWARPVFRSEGIDPADFVTQEMVKFVNIKNIKLEDISRLASVLSESRFNPENKFCFLDLVNGFCGRAQYVIGISPNSFKIKVGRNIVDVLFQEGRLMFFTQQESGVLIKHMVAGISYGMPDGELKPIWYTNTSVCVGTPSNHSQCSVVPDRTITLMALNDPDLVQDFSDHGIKCTN